jgi:DNA primase
MAYRRNAAGTIDAQNYAPSQVKSILKSLGVEVVSETYNDFLCLCPIHGNRNTPSFSVSRERGAWLCFNPSCGEAGSLVDLVKKMTNRNEFEAIRYISAKQDDTGADFDEQLSELLDKTEDFVEFPEQVLKNLYNDLLASQEAKDYFGSRGINLESISHFALGYSPKQNMVTVPVHSPDGLPVGIVGRSISEKRFKNSTNLPRSKTMFNIHRAKRLSGTVIVVESSFDAIRVHQAGYPNVVATLGGHISPDNISLLNKYFNKIIIMTDNDEKQFNESCRKCYPAKCSGHSPGRDLGFSIANKLKNKDIMWACYDYNTIYPHNAKDVGDMTDEEIKQCVKNSLSHFEYVSTNPA